MHAKVVVCMLACMILPVHACNIHMPHVCYMHAKFRREMQNVCKYQMIDTYIVLPYLTRINAKCRHIFVEQCKHSVFFAKCLATILDFLKAEEGWEEKEISTKGVVDR